MGGEEEVGVEDLSLNRTRSNSSLHRWLLRKLRNRLHNLRSNRCKCRSKRSEMRSPEGLQEFP